MNNYMYEKVNKDKREKKDTKFTMIITIIIVISLFVIGSFAWSFGFRYRFSHFLKKFSECNSYSEKEDSLTVEMDGKIYKVTDDNRQGIFNYIILNNSGKESNKLPEEEPLVLDYGNGAVIKLWRVPPDKYTNGSGLFLHYEDTDGFSYSYINYKMTLETIITRYLLYDNIELTEDKTDTEEMLVSENDVKKSEIKESELKNKVEEIKNETEDEVNIVDEKITIQDMDWDAYQNIMNTEEYEVLLEYLPVLKNEVTFIWDIDFYNEREQKIVTIDEFRYILDNEIWDAGYDPDELWVDSIAICDLDEDGTKELILLLKDIRYHFLILHKENEEFYGTSRDFRAFIELQTNGTYAGSAGAAYSHYYKMKFIDGKFEEFLLGRTALEDNDGIPEVLYYIGEEMTKDYDVYEEWLEGIMSEDVVYYDAVRKE